MLKSAVKGTKSAIEEPMLHIQELETDVYRRANLVSQESDSQILTEIIERIQQSAVSSKVSNQERRARLSAWINGIDTKKTYDTGLRYRHAGTCEWILQLEELRAWHSGEPVQAKLLWVHGPAGFGNTFLSAWITQHLKAIRSGPVAYFFCVADDQSTRDPYAILRSWLSQALDQDDRIPDIVESISNTRNKANPMTHAELCELFVVIGAVAPGCIFIIAGFDECSYIDSGARYHKQDPLNYFLR